MCIRDRLLALIAGAMVIRAILLSLNSYRQLALRAMQLFQLLQLHVGHPHRNYSSAAPPRDPGEQPSPLSLSLPANDGIDPWHTLVHPFLRISIGDRFERLARHILPMTRSIWYHQNSLTFAFDLRFRFAVSSVWQYLLRVPTTVAEPELTTIQVQDLMRDLTTLLDSLEPAEEDLSLLCQVAQRMLQCLNKRYRRSVTVLHDSAEGFEFSVPLSDFDLCANVRELALVTDECIASVTRQIRVIVNLMPTAVRQIITEAKHHCHVRQACKRTRADFPLLRPYDLVPFPTYSSLNDDPDSPIWVSAPFLCAVRHNRLRSWSPFAPTFAPDFCNCIEQSQEALSLIHI